MDKKHTNVGLRDQRAAFECQYNVPHLQTLEPAAHVKRDPRKHRSLRRRPRKRHRNRSKRRGQLHRSPPHLLPRQERCPISESRVSSPVASTIPFPSY